ncbi:thioredoxin [Pontibacillus halophilus JSM 076056 = DSM 19796]|uniref:Thioredoxin n=1 Tax=Pontibacillus halophilus JSM 076056 = DSM 19796 TaxID=1385510 RepID=A0A0A5IAG3_9BACI|nr:TlpA disulfide reductase family protein [Pontibacillus halophilus]KGX92827.1 thioredoxin [Pontibacillus halophilus JSM 076056 = DSM 19796]
MKAPMFTLPTIDEESSYSLSDDLGKIVILTFWASWCPDTARDLPKKEQFHQSADSDMLSMVTINVPGRERSDEAELQYANKYLSQLTLKDRGREIYDKYGCTGVPTTAIINREGDIHEVFGDKASMMEIVQSVGQLLAR